MKKIRSFYYQNELFVKLVMLFVFGTIVVATTVVYFSIRAAEKAYISSYKETSGKLLKKIGEDYESLNDSIVNTFQNLANKPEIKHYLSANDTDPISQNKTIYGMRQEIKDTSFLYDNISSNLAIIGKNGNSFYQSEVKPLYQVTELVANPIFKEASQTPGQMIYHFVTSGYTSHTEHDKGLLIVKALHDQGEVYGFAMMMISETEFSRFYTNLLDSNITKIWIYNPEKFILSSNQKADIGKNIDSLKYQSKQTLVQAAKEDNAVSSRKVYSFNYELISQIDERLLVKKMVLVPTAITTSIIAILVISLIAFIIIKRTTSPIYEVTRKIPSVIQGDFSQAVTVRGTHEIRQLIDAYNFMLGGLNNYVRELLNKENEKRHLEIHALQMQIQPHFIYNTLTAIKFLIQKGQNEQATQAITSFIRLLRNTVSKEEQLISLTEELQLLEDYIFILQIRFGNTTQVTIHNMLPKSLWQIPRMLLQPIVENAFIHAFPKQQNGHISIIITQWQDSLAIEIIDDGIGFTYDLMDQNSKKDNHFSGIGLKNVRDRLRLIYGEEAVLDISSQVKLGTTVKLIIPQKKN